MVLRRAANADSGTSQSASILLQALDQATTHLINDDVAALRSECHCDAACEDVDAVERSRRLREEKAGP